MAFNSTEDKAKGWANTVSGNVKTAAGQFAGDTDLEATGETEKAKGLFQRTLGTAKDAAQAGLKKTGDLIEKAGDVVEHNVSKRLGNAIEKVGDAIEHLGEKKDDPTRKL